jgi:putative peptide maturation dehydrogenase
MVLAMSYVRRCFALQLHRIETIEFDPGRLLAGDGGLKLNLSWEAIAGHLERPVRVKDEEVSAVSQFGPTLWIDRRQAELKVSSAMVEKLLELGLLVNEDDAGVAATADARLRTVAWHPMSAVSHRTSRWSRHDAEAARRGIQFDAIGRLVERYGSPPPEFHERLDRKTRLGLPVPVPDELDALLQRRVTCRNFDLQRSLSLAEVSELLSRVFGVQGEETLAPGAVALKKNHPSGGALHPFEAYLVLRRVEGLPVGLYHYNVRAHALDLLRELAPDEAEALILNGVAGQQFFADAPAHVVLTARFARSQWKYRENSKVYRVIQIEAGHIAQNLYLSATHQGLGAYITAAINEVELEQAFGIDGMEEGPLAVCGFGWRATERTTVELDPAGKVWPA